MAKRINKRSRTKTAKKAESRVSVPAKFKNALTKWFGQNYFADRTLPVYRHAIDEWFQQARPWEEDWQQRSIKWAHKLNARALKTKSVYVGAAKKFIDFLYSQDIIDVRHNPLTTVRMRGVKASGIKRRALTDDEVNAILDTCNTTNLIGLRDRCIIRVMIYTALRISAVAGILIEDLFQSKKRWYVVYQGKGQESKERNKPLNSLVVSAIEDYLESSGRSLDDTGPLFLSYDKPLQASGIRSMLKRKFKLCGIKDRNVSVHSLRHTAATKAIEMGIPIKELQLFLDHSSVQTTEGYVHERRSIDELEDINISYDEEE